ncbi:MAG: hypothetical protein II305_02630 [Clostridia bacterium]|nr:hypothetical protein [Clostridia bacterium]
MAVGIRNSYLPVEHFVPFAKGTVDAGANCRGEGVSLAVLPPFLCAVKEMGVNITNNNPSPDFVGSSLYTREPSLRVLGYPSSVFFATSCKKSTFPQGKAKIKATLSGRFFMLLR